MPDDPLMTIEDAVEQFNERHFEIFDELVKRDRLAIYWAMMSNTVIHDGYVALDEVLMSEPTLGPLLNMLDRTFEHAEGALVSCAAGCMASAEVVARAAIESSVNVMYTLDGDKLARLEAYFRAYLDGVHRYVTQWLKLTSGMDDSKAEVHRNAALYRLKGVEAVESFVDRAMLAVGMPKGSSRTVKWPHRIADRFDALGLEDMYRTVYARMCSQVHNDAEDTLNFCIAVASSDQRVLEQMGLETVNFSRLLVFYGVSFYMQASIKYAESFGMTRAAESLRRGYAIIEQQIREISRHVGSYVDIESGL